MPDRRKPARPRPVPDRHLLYERAVQDPRTELVTLKGLLRGGRVAARRLREDFSGTAALAAAWVEAGPTRTAVAVDLDPEVHDWARTHRLPGMGKAARRLRLVRADVRQGPRGPFDAVVALNFSWQVFRTREELGGYFTAARRALAPGGALVLDLYGGWGAQRPLRERRRLRGGAFYVWEQEGFDPITHRFRASIHFELKDGRRLRHAFRYDWRLWTLPEVTELLAEAGFGDVQVWWDVAPDPERVRYTPLRHAENIAGWIAYVVARNARPRSRR